MIRMILVVAALYAMCCALAVAQSAPASDSRSDSERRPAPPAERVAAGLQRSNGSLLRASIAADVPNGNNAGSIGGDRPSDVSFFTVPPPKPRMMKKHDLVTIVIREESEFSAEGTTDLKKETQLEAKVEEFVKLSLKNFEIQGGAQGPTPPGITINSRRENKGEATVDRADRFTERVTAEVVDVKPNGTLVLQARSAKKIDEEEQELTFTGICRVEDVALDNTILSTQIFDQNLTKVNRGAVRDTTKRGWLVKLLDALSPL